MGVRIIGVGGYVPRRVVTNDELAREVDTSHEWIASHTGILERRVAAIDEAPSDMGLEAARQCLQNAELDRLKIDLIIVASATPDQPQPAVACIIQEKLGIASTECPAFDVNSVCSGFVFALDVAQSMMLASPSRFRHALVIGTDAFSRILDWHDRRTCIFFGDGAGAVLLAYVEGDTRIHFRLGSDGRGRCSIQVPAGGSRVPIDANVLAKRLNKFSMDGPKVWDFAVQTVPRVIRSLLSEHGLEPKDISLVVLHQSNLRMMEKILASLEMSPDQTVTTVERYGNTAAASIPLTLQRAAELGRLQRGAKVLLCGFGGGLSWGAAVLEW